MKIQATFSNGKTISRNTSKDFRFAYLSTNIYQSHTGFAATQDLAMKAAQSTFGSCPKPHTIEIVEVAH